RASQEAVWASGLVQPDEGARLHQQLAQLVVLLLRAIAPVNAVGLAERGHLLNPGAQLDILDISWGERSVDGRDAWVVAADGRPRHRLHGTPLRLSLTRYQVQQWAVIP